MKAYITPTIIRHRDFGDQGFALVIATGLADPVFFQSYDVDRTPVDSIAYDDERSAIKRFEGYEVAQEQLLIRLRWD